MGRSRHSLEKTLREPTGVTLLKACVLWLALLALAMLNGTAREKLLVPSLGPFAAPWVGRLSYAQWLGIGVLWLVMTLAFEFGFGRLVQHKTWAELLEAYSFTDGNLWPLVLATVLISPWLGAKLRGLVE